MMPPPTMPDAPVFTLEEVNALVARLKPLVTLQMGRRSGIEQRLEALASVLGSVPDSFEIQAADGPNVTDLKRELAARVAAYHAAWREIEGLGAVLKDPRLGLFDFYGQVDGKLVWLCWKYDEEAVAHYHGLDEGFARRRPIESTMRLRHLN